MARKNKDAPWLCDSYGDEPETPNDYNRALYDPPEDYATLRRNRQMIRQHDGYYNDDYNGRGGAEEVQNPPRVVGRRWGLLLEKYGKE